jgi:hypothetical protein
VLPETIVKGEGPLLFPDPTAGEALLGGIGQ